MIKISWICEEKEKVKNKGLVSFTLINIRIIKLEDAFIGVTSKVKL